MAGGPRAAVDHPVVAHPAEHRLDAEVLEGEADGIELRVADRAVLVFAVKGHEFAGGEVFVVAGGGVELGDLEGR